MRYSLLGLVLFFFFLLVACNTNRSVGGEAVTSTVYEKGWEGYSHFRIPSLLRNDRFLFVFAEGRRNSVSDHGDISIVLRRSTDGGRSWGDLIRVVELPGESAQNPAPVYVEEENKLVLLFTKRTVGSDTERMIRDGSSEGYVGVYQTESMDQGETWSEVREITSSVKRDNWRWYALGPGGVIRLQYHKHHRGRIIVPANHSIEGGPENEFLGGHVIYSDDGGNTWNIGAVDSQGKQTINPNETTVVELRKGGLYFNTRNHSYVDTVAHRAVAYSMDAGLSFTDKYAHEPQLRTPIVHASITRDKRNLYFFAPKHETDRRDLSMWRSRDEGMTWQLDRLVYSGSAAYSSACLLADGSVGLLLEVDDYGRILFKKIPV